MKIKNKTWSQLVISLSAKRSIVLAARGTGQINEEDFNSPECQRLFKERSIILLNEASKKGSPSERELPAEAADTKSKKKTK